jgi:myo-inositol 2-dehydrogenase / D-chiro-inositol 1-dehydrogenase
MAKVKVGIIGSQFEADIHAASFQIMPEQAEVVAVASPTEGHAAELAQRYGIPRVFRDYREMLAEPDIEMVTITAPNTLHRQITCDAARAGKHVVCEKPMAMTLAEADEMIDTCHKAGVLLFYAEELFFTPKYVKAKEMADQGAFGKVHLIKQSEKHFGPHSAWFWDVERSGGGVWMDMGCHGIAFCYWFLGRPKIESVYCQMGTHVHRDKTVGEDEVIGILEFAGGAVGLVENSWARATAICTWATHSPRIASAASAMRSRKPRRQPAGAIRCSKSCGITASRKRCATSRAACAARSNREPRATTGAWFWKHYARATHRQAADRKWRCHSIAPD